MKTENFNASDVKIKEIRAISTTFSSERKTVNSICVVFNSSHHKNARLSINRSEAIKMIRKFRILLDIK